MILTNIEKFTRAGIPFIDTSRARRRVAEWEQKFDLKTDSPVSLESPKCADEAMVDDSMRTYIAELTNALLGHPHKDIVNLAPAVRHLIQRHNFNNRITAEIVWALRNWTEVGGGLSARHRAYAVAKAIQHPYYELLYDVAGESVKLNPPHPESVVGRTVANFFHAPAVHPGLPKPKAPGTKVVAPATKPASVAATAPDTKKPRPAKVTAGAGLDR